MTETERWIEQTRKLLKRAAAGGRCDTLDSVRDHMRRIDVKGAMRDLGCGEECSECSWGVLGGFPLQGNCRLAEFQEILKNAGDTEDGAAALQQDAATLLAVLESFPKPGRR